jgi:galactitol-specific phosphotransferase system IIB component
MLQLSSLKSLLKEKETVVEVEKLTKDEAETRTNTFKIVVKTADYEKAMDPEVWPYRVGVRHFKPPRRSRQGMTWNEQSQQNGGQVGKHHQRLLYKFTSFF